VAGLIALGFSVQRSKLKDDEALSKLGVNLNLCSYTMGPQDALTAGDTACRIDARRRRIAAMPPPPRRRPPVVQSRACIKIRVESARLWFLSALEARKPRISCLLLR
jgi:hypothetical protein